MAQNKSWFVYMNPSNSGKKNWLSALATMGTREVLVALLVLPPARVEKVMLGGQVHVTVLLLLEVLLVLITRGLRGVGGGVEVIIMYLTTPTFAFIMAHQLL